MFFFIEMWLHLELKLAQSLVQVQNIKKYYFFCSKQFFWKQYRFTGAKNKKKQHRYEKGMSNQSMQT